MTPSYGQKWRSRTDHAKVLTVQWCNTCDVVGFSAPWFARNYSTLNLDVFLRRYEPVPSEGNNNNRNDEPKRPGAMPGPNRMEN